jgi:hypothetical protein
LKCLENPGAEMMDKFLVSPVKRSNTFYQGFEKGGCLILGSDYPKMLHGIFTNTYPINEPIM